MENSCEVGNDQSSGWLEVKKKHRGSSKFSIHSVGRESSRKNSNGKGGNSHRKLTAESLKAGSVFHSHFQGILPPSTCIKKQNEEIKSYSTMCVVGADSACSSELASKTKTLAGAGSRFAQKKIACHEKLDAVPKLKWGDLEDDDYFPGHDNSSASEIKFGEIGDDDLAICKMSENATDMSLFNASQGHAEGADNVFKTEDAGHDTEHYSLDNMTEDNCKKITGALKNTVEFSTTRNKELDLCAGVSDIAVSSQYVSPVDTESISNKSLYMDKDQHGCSAYATVTEKVSESILSTNLGDSAISNIAYVSNEQGSAISCQGTEAITLDWIADLTCQRDTATTHSMDTKAMLDSGEKLGGVEKFEENRSSNAEELSRKISRAHIMSSLGEKEEGKSKERFRERLWCFLFENLNRAVEELYLLCELECDLEQVTEAVLVLEEAGSDFKELNTRIKEFDKLKRNSTRLAEEALMTMKSDHRRPHALSWEVRRMTSTPRRAEILSSSLEAFKKIQAERVKMQAASDQNVLGRNWWCGNPVASDVSNKYVTPESTADTEVKSRKNNSIFNPTQASLLKEKKCTETDGSNKLNPCRSYRLSSLGTSIHDQGVSRFPSEGTPSTIVGERSKREQGSSVQPEKRLNFSYQPKSQIASNKEKEKEKTFVSWKSMDAWKEKRNWEEILASPCRMSSRLSHSPYMSRKSAERARILHDKLLSSEKKKKTALDLKREAEEKHARAMRIRNELENERAQKLQKTSEKLNRVSEWQAVRSMKLREGMYARHQRSESRHVAHIAQVVRRAGDESIKVNEVRFITSLNEENKKFMLRQKLHDSQIRRAEKLQVLKIKQKEEMAREEAVLERRKLIEAEKLQRLAEIQRKKEVAQSRREEERKASSTAREAKAMEQLRRREERAKAQQEEAEMLAQKLAERLSENEQRRKVYLEQIRERASMDLRDHCSPLVRRSLGKDTQGRSTPTSGGEDYLANIASGSGDSHRASSSAEIQHVLKRRVKKIRQRLMALKHDFLEPSLPENSGIGYRTTLANARAKVGRWLQDLQRYRLARKDGASNIGLITAEMIKFLEGKEVELQASRQAGLLNFISSTLPASHISKPESCQVTINMLRLLKVVLVVPINRVFFLSQNLLPPIIPMLSAALENYIKIAASLNSPNSSNLSTSKASSENFDSISEVIDGILWTVTMIVGHESSDERHIQMQDGLLELVVSHQIIHRLRDLFALYDKPQVDGSPFPSSILLSINLLVTLTSRQRDISSINWDSFSCEDIQKEVSLPSIPGDADSYDSCLSYPIGDHTSPAIDGNLAELHATGEVEHFGIVCESKRGGVDYVTAAAESLKELKNSLITSNLTDGVTKEESKRNAGAAIPGASIPQKGDKKPMDKSVEGKNEKLTRCKSPQGALVTAISETGLVSLLSLLTAVLLQANSRSSEQPSYVLPSNFEEVATGVLKVLNNLAVGDLTFMQQMLARPDLKMEFFHIMSFLLTHCTNQWKTPSDQIGLLLSESLLLLGYFSLFHPENQAVLRWGKSPTILHKVCDLPFVFFSDPELMPLLAGALVAACFGCKQNKGVVQQELSIEMLVSMVKSCKSTISKENALLESADKLLNSETLKLVQQAAEPAPHKFGRPTMRNGGGGSRQSIIVKGCAPGNGGSNNNRSRARILKDSRVGSSRAFDEVNNSSRHNNKVVVAVTPDRTITRLMLHCRFPESFINRVEKFFAMEDDQQPG